MDGAEFAPAGSLLLAVALLLLGAMVLFFAVVSWHGGPERNVATADRQDLRSVLWTSRETWQAAHRTSGPWLLTAAIGLLIAGVFSLGAIAVHGPGDAIGSVLAASGAGLASTIVFCMTAGVRGRVAARRVRDDRWRGGE
ncbi:SdpI family protein [Microbacterium sp. G2-8]|uniref:SdpI family protein n=1 Tax=Microbacterium sp. G2-8 TaxID=2842454 RepID=UPI001C8A9389|nr:SdpI family protein [Microbacterium sp. G2-8]